VGSSIGAKVLDPGLRFVLYKNRDLPVPELDDRIVYTPRVFAVEGADVREPRGSVEYSGYALGVNAAGLACAGARVTARRDVPNEDALVQLVLEHSGSVFEALDFVRDEAAARRFSWSNLVLADRHGVAAVEVRDSARVYQHPRQINRANHHVGWGFSVREQDHASRQRFALARDLLDEAQTPADVMSLCRSHVPSAGQASICRHGETTTVYSYVIEVVHGTAILYVQRGNPCRGEYTRIALHFPPRPDELAATFRLYPAESARSATPSSPQGS
jgi:hypothetical protein